MEKFTLELRPIFIIRIVIVALLKDISRTTVYILRIMVRKIMSLTMGIGIFLTITAFGNGFNSAYAKHDTVRVDCKDLAIALITWDQLLAFTDDDTRTDIEDNLGEDGVANGLFQDWIDKYLDDLVDDVDDDCNHLKNDIEDYLDGMELEVP
jgi:hypothetical protein